MFSSKVADFRSRRSCRQMFFATPKQKARGLGHSPQVSIFPTTTSTVLSNKSSGSAQPLCMKYLTNFILIDLYSLTATSSFSESQRRNFPKASAVRALLACRGTIGDQLENG